MLLIFFLVFCLNADLPETPATSVQALGNVTFGESDPRSVRCEADCGDSLHSYTLKIDVLPSVLVIQLVRFTYEEGGGHATKIMTRVQLTETINAMDWCVEGVRVVDSRNGNSGDEDEEENENENEDEDAHFMNSPHVHYTCNDPTCRGLTDAAFTSEIAWQEKMDALRERSSAQRDTTAATFISTAAHRQQWDLAKQRLKDQMERDKGEWSSYHDRNCVVVAGVNTDVCRPAPPTTPRVLHNEENNGAATHMLVGIVKHVGPHARSGHYITDVRESNGLWTRYDDERVTSDLSFVQINTIMDQQQCYLLFYTAVGNIVSDDYDSGDDNEGDDSDSNNNTYDTNDTGNHHHVRNKRNRNTSRNRDDGFNQTPDVSTKTTRLEEEERILREQIEETEEFDRLQRSSGSSDSPVYSSHSSNDDAMDTDSDSGQPNEQ